MVNGIENSIKYSVRSRTRGHLKEEPKLDIVQNFGHDDEISITAGKKYK
jgi:hypothetical protein